MYSSRYTKEWKCEQILYEKSTFFFSEILVNTHWSINGVKLSKHPLGFKRKRDFFDEI